MYNGQLSVTWYLQNTKRKHFVKIQNCLLVVLLYYNNIYHKHYKVHTILFSKIMTNNIKIYIIKLYTILTKLRPKHTKDCYEL